ncbi:uncharacterized protein ACR2FA_000680 [Aphomia sociella]
MCCGCCGCGGGGFLGIDLCFSNLLYVFERLAACCAFTAVVTCIVVTLIVMLGMGVGVGYNYCFVNVKTHVLPEKGPDNVIIDKNSTNTTTSSYYYVTSVPVFTETGLSTSTPSTTNISPTPSTTRTPPTTSSTMETKDFIITLLRGLPSNENKASKLYFLRKSTTVMPLLQNMDLPALIKKIREQKRNLTLEFVFV